MSTDKLDKEIEKGRQHIHTDGYTMSVGEIISLYENQEIDIHPEFQRFFRWSDEQKSKLIESILLGIPIPSIFVAQNKDGTWDVIDGLQRLSTIFQLAGILKDKDSKKLEPLKLSKTKYLGSLEGKQWTSKNKKTELSESQKLLIKRSKFDIKIIKRESDTKTKYELFQRINSGGSSLTAQELRNCLLVMVNPDYFEWLSKLSKHPSFISCTALSDSALSERYDLDLIVRFLSLRKLSDQDLKSIGDIGEFLDEKIVELASDSKFNYVEEEAIFKETFDLLAKGMSPDSENCFRRYDIKKNRFMGGFLISAYEAVALGIGFNVKSKKNTALQQKLRENIKSIWKNTLLKNNSGSGVRANIRIPIALGVGRKIFKP